MTELTAGAIEAVERLAHAGYDEKIVDLVEGRKVGIILRDDENLHEIDLEQYAHRPARMTGAVRLHDAESFVTYVNRHKVLTDTTLWADVDTAKVVAILNDHGTGIDPEGNTLHTGYAGWRDHSATLGLVHTPDWLHWLSQDGKLIGQEAFALHLEQGASCVRHPSAADMLEIAQSFVANTGVDFKAATRLTSGETKIQYEETTTAKAGQRGEIEIPSMFTLALQPYRSGGVYEVQARFLYRINSGNLLLGYRLIRPDAVRDVAFADLTHQIGDDLALPMLAGLPK